MRVMVLGKATDSSEKSAPPAKEAFAAMDRFIEELVKAGIMVAGAGLQNNAEAKRITSDGSGSTVIDGPFAETRELVAGFMIWQVNWRVHARLRRAIGHGRGRGLGEAQSHVGPGRGRDPPVLRGGGSGRVSDARGALDAP